MARVFAAESQVIHGALACGRNSCGRGFGKGAEQGVHHALRGFDISAGDCGRRARIYDGTGRGDDSNWRHQARGRGHVLTEQAPENVIDRGDRDGFDGVYVASALQGRAGEVYFGMSTGPGRSRGADAYADSNL